MTIISFVKTLPENLVYAPIYKKDAVMKSGRKATGKNPLEESWERDFDKHDVELAIEKNPETRFPVENNLWGGEWITRNYLIKLNLERRHLKPMKSSCGIWDRCVPKIEVGAKKCKTYKIHL